MRLCRQHGIAAERCNPGCDYIDSTRGTVVTESRASCVVEPDGKLRISGMRVTDDHTASGVVCEVDVRRGIDEHLTVTVSGAELLRMVHDVVYILAYGAGNGTPR